MGIAEEIKESFKKGNVLTKLIYINLAVFLFIKIIQAISFMLGLESNLAEYTLFQLSVPSDLHELATKPWTVFTYMFLHEGFIHILFNLLWLYWMGKIFLQYLHGKKLLGIYILGGLSGAFLYILAYNTLPGLSSTHSSALGASAAVMAIVFATATYAPSITIYLLFLGPVKLKWLAFGCIVIDIIFMTDGNAGGHIAHLGGALYGYLYMVQLRKGKDIAARFNRLMDTLFTVFKARKKLKITHKKTMPDIDLEYNAQKANMQKEIDNILDKIAKSGYESLSKRDKEILFKMSNKK